MPIESLQNKFCCQNYCGDDESLRNDADKRFEFARAVGVNEVVEALERGQPRGAQFEISELEGVGQETAGNSTRES